jgi:hypothetical protein
MADPMGLDVHDLHIAHVNRYDQAGRAVPQTMLTYSVGPHGPFMHTFDAADATPEKINAAIDRQIADLRAVVGRTA